MTDATTDAPIRRTPNLFARRARLAHVRPTRERRDKNGGKHRFEGSPRIGIRPALPSLAALQTRRLPCPDAGLPRFAPATCLLASG